MLFKALSSRYTNVLDKSDVSVTLSLYPNKGFGAVRYKMSNTDKLSLICMLGIVIGFIMITIDVQRTAYNKGVRDGYHRGRAVREGKPEIIAVPSDLKEVKE